MTASNEHERVDHDLRGWEADLERGLGRGVLRQGRISHLPSKVNWCCWTPHGGAVACADEELGRQLATTISGHVGTDYEALLPQLQEMVRRGLPESTWTLFAALYCLCSSASADVPMLARVETMTVDEFWPDGDNMPGMEHVFLVGEGSVIAARATNRRGLQVGDHWLHAIGVGTHPDYRRQGYGKAVVTAALRYLAAEEDATALWNCDTANVASHNLARSVGFIDHIWVFSQGQPRPGG